MSRSSLARICCASVLIVSLFGLGTASAHAAEDGSALASALLSKPVVVVHAPVALTSARGEPVDSHEIARRLLGGNPAAKMPSGHPGPAAAVDTRRTADASDAARRMILGAGS